MLPRLFEFTSNSPADTAAFAGLLLERLVPGAVVLLEGNLGSGKTFLVKELCRLLKTSVGASSPTFAIVQQYPGPVPVNHLDLYRIEKDDELDQLGWEELVAGPGYSFIEWPERLQPFLNTYFLVKIELNGETRQFKVYQKV